LKGSLMLKRFISFLRIGLINPRLLLFVWQIKREKKTFLCYTKLLSLITSYFEARKRATGPIMVAEFGVGRGGSAALLAWLVQKYGGRLVLYDIFGRIPAPTDKDGERAQERYRIILHHEKDSYYGNIPNLFEVIQKEIAEVCDPSRVEYVRGRYEETLPGLEDDYVFNLVHIDCDWYESSQAVLRYLQTRLSPGAILQVDDYSNWEGSNRALNEAEWLKGYGRKLVEGALHIDMAKTSAVNPV